MISLAIIPMHLLAHGDHDHAADARWWTLWNADLPTHLCLAALTVLYATGLTRLWRRAGVGRGVRVGHAAAFGAGVLTLYASLLSPIDVLSDDLQWMHMVQHMLLMMVAAPLVILGCAGQVLLWTLPDRWRQRFAQWFARFNSRRMPFYLLWQPIVLWLIFAGVLWVWHLPTLYEAALTNRLVHDFQHVGFFVSACLFWRVLIDPLSRLRVNPALGVVYLFATSLHATLLGVFMALAPAVWYGFYADTTSRWNLTALEDQQLAGMIMWMPMCMLYALAAALILGAWLGKTPLDRTPRPQSS